MNTINYRTKGICAKEIKISIENGIVTGLTFIGGCEGNATGVSRLVVGMTINEVIIKLRGIDCEGKGTSCPDQLAKALEEVISLNQGIA